MKQPELDYEVKGVVEQHPITTGSMFVLAAILTGMGIYFANDMDEPLLIPVLAAGGLLCIAIGVAGTFVKYYWGDEQFTVCQPPVKPVTYKYEELANITQDSQAITLIMKDRKKLMIPMAEKGLGDFINQLKVYFNANADQNDGNT